MKVKLITALITIAAAVVVGLDAYQRYQRAVHTEPRWETSGSVQALVPQAADGIRTRVTLGIRSTIDTVHPKIGAEGDPRLQIEVILTTPPTQPAESVGILLTGSARDQFIVVQADGIDQETGHAVASVNVDVDTRFDWCQRSQCFVTAPTVLPPVIAPWLRSATGDATEAERKGWWDRFTDPLHRNEPQRLNGTQEVNAGYLPLTATLVSASPATTFPKREGDRSYQDRLQWSSSGELTVLGKITDSDREAAQQNSVFIAGLEIGIATSLIPWALQMLIELGLNRARPRRRSP